MYGLQGPETPMVRLESGPEGSWVSRLPDDTDEKFGEDDPSQRLKVVYTRLFLVTVIVDCLDPGADRDGRSSTTGVRWVNRREPELKEKAMCSYY